MANPVQPDLRLGMSNMMISCVAFACTWVLVRMAGETMNFMVVVFARTLVGSFFVLPRLRVHGRDLVRTRLWGWHIVRAITGLTAALCTFYAVTAAPLADVVAITYAAPLFAAIAAVLLLGEVIRLRRVVALVIGFLGMLVVIRPGYQELTPGLLAAIVAALSIASSMTFVKIMAREDSPESIVSLNYMLMLPASFIIALPFWEWPNWQEALILIGVGIGASWGQITFARAFAYADATAILPLDFIRLLLAALFGYLFFAEQLDVWTGVGAAIILTSTIYVAHRERLMAKQEANRIQPGTAP